MAFSTIQGSGGAPDSFVGTSGVDSISIINSTGNFFLGAQEADDVVTLLTAGATDPGVITGATLKGGQGNDTITDTNLAVLNGVFLNGNANADTITFNSALLSATTVQGGQGVDTITANGGVVASLINGNKDNDVITIASAAASNSSVFGGQGNDAININIGTTSSVIDGDDDNDTITFGTTAAISVAGSTVFGGQGNDTIAATNVTSAVLVFGEDGNDTIATGALRDTISGGAGNDNIAAGAGIDVMTGDAGQDTFVQSASGLGAAATATVFASTSFSNGDTLTFGNGLDIVTDFTANDLLDTSLAAGVVAGLNGQATSTNGASNFFLQGTYNATTSVFTVGNTAANIDYLVAPNGGVALAANTSLILLDNLGTAPVAANFV